MVSPFYLGFASALMYAQVHTAQSGGASVLASRLPYEDNIGDTFSKKKLALAIQRQDEGGIFYFRFVGIRDGDAIEITNSEMDAEMPAWANA